jgi:glycopeptide antibiotics resistance protein
MAEPGAERLTAGDNATHRARGWVVAAALVYGAFFVYGSLVPLRWSPHTLAAAWQGFLALPGPQWRGEDRVDVAVNFLLTVPLAFALTHLALSLPRRPLRLAGVLLVWPGMALLSVAVEFAQVFFPPRDPSWTDVAAQWAGAAAGMAAYAAAGARFRALLDGLAAHHPAQARIRRWLGIYLGLLLAFGLMPLDLTLSPVEIYRKWRGGGVILLPFGAPWPGTWQFVYDFLTDIALWVPVGLLWRIDGQGRRYSAVIWRGLAAAALLECAQLLVLSRVSDVTDVLLAGVGVAIGAALPGWLRGRAVWHAARQRRWLAGGWWIWLAVAVLLLWSPFDFSLDRFSLGRTVAAFTRLPFQTYFFRGEFYALNEIVRKLMVFLPGGLLLGAWVTRRPGAQASALWLAGMWMLALVLEVGQLFLPSKVADLTDAVLGGLGAWAGWRIARSLELLAQEAVQVVAAVAEPPRAVSASPSRPALRGQAFWLLGGLALLFWLAGRLPGLPYNVAKLIPAGVGGALSAMGLAFALWWMLAAPLWLLQPERRAWRLMFPLLLAVHGLVAFAVLRATVPLAMLYKIIGDPVLGWGGAWEDIGRYLALHASVMLPLFGAALLVRTVQRPAAVTDLLLWCFVMLLLYWPLHWVVVEQAGTDNLVELMRGGGSLATSAALGAGWGLVALAGSALGAATAPRRRGVLLGLAATAMMLAPCLFAAGLEPMLVKYGRAFSALQFIVSAGRDHYATGAALTLRAALALAVLVLSVATLQALAWRALAAADATRTPRKARPAADLAAA